MTNASVITEASRRAGGIVALGLWIGLGTRCTMAAPPGTSVQMVSGSSTASDGGGPANDAASGDADNADADDGQGPVYMGAPGATEQPTMSGSIAAPDGSCPIPATLPQSGVQCPSCAQTHCASALEACDPTMVNACTEYYCPMQCLSPNAAAAASCTMLQSCCPTLFGTVLNSQCLQAQVGGVASACASFITQVQAKGYCK
jgi:hypothetical protein